MRKERENKISLKWKEEKLFRIRNKQEPKQKKQVRKRKKKGNGMRNKPLNKSETPFWVQRYAGRILCY